MNRIQNQPSVTTSLIGKKNEADSPPSTSFLRHLAGCFNSSESLSVYRGKTSTLCNELRKLYLAQDNDDLSSGCRQTAKERADNIEILTTLNSEKNRKDFEILAEYIEGGSGLYKTINNHLRSIFLSEEGKRLSDELKEVFSKLNYYNAPAYRAMVVPAGTYGGKIKTNDVVMDEGFMSASALPRNSIDWLERWTNQDHRHGMEKLILIFDGTASKKMAAGGMLPDHILVAPNTPFKVKEIHITDGRPERDIITLIRLKISEHPFRHDIKDIFSGNVKLTATEGSVFKRLNPKKYGTGGISGNGYAGTFKKGAMQRTFLSLQKSAERSKEPTSQRETEPSHNRKRTACVSQRAMADIYQYRGIQAP